ncbi:MAG: hypothetical protein C4581_13410 [Nitrospiraceae bacterium]|nr:MAG: hypothetical protein C4581_13410 [Nitrospiraceae bacterium]
MKDYSTPALIDHSKDFSSPADSNKHSSKKRGNSLAPICSTHEAKKIGLFINVGMPGSGDYAINKFNGEITYYVYEKLLGT